jgi:uncharacterized protein (TIGR00297 family)
MQIIARLCVGVLLASAMAIGGYRKRSLSMSGAIGAFIVGALTSLAGVRYALTLIAFFVSSSALTKYKAEQKSRLEDNHKVGGQRDIVQVAANSAVGLLTCIGSLLLCSAAGYNEFASLSSAHCGQFSMLLAVAFVGHYAACAGDTWASELGILSRREPLLVVAPWRRVPHGTNGGVSLIGTLASLAGGLFVGAVFYALGFVIGDGDGASTTPPQWPIVLVGAFAGAFGSFVDSLLGATLQYSGYCSVKRRVVESPLDGAQGADSVQHITGWDLLDNHQVNFVATAITSAATLAIGVLLF